MARVATLLTFCALLIVGGVKAQTYTSPADAVAKTRDLSTLLAAVTAADLVPLLSNSTANLTVLAPTNTAFTTALQALQPLTPAQLLGSSLLSTILKYHVIQGAATASALTNGQTLYTYLGQPLTVEKNGDSVSFKSTSGNSAAVITPNVQAGNSVVHIINAVLIPTTLTSPSSAPASAPRLAEALAIYQRGLAPAPAK